MTDVPSHVDLSEVGPREVVQLWLLGIPIDQKVRMIDALTEAGVPEIECAPLMNRKVAPQLADVHDIGAGIREWLFAEREPDLPRTF